MRSSPLLRFLASRTGLILGIGFFALAWLAWSGHLADVKSNPGNSGEPGIVMLLFTAPWVFWSDPGPVAERTMWFMVGTNSLLLYLVGCALGAFFDRARQTDKTG